MNQSIKAMIDAYEDTFTEDVWEGRHKTLWILADDNSSRNTYFKKRMSSLKKDFETEVDALKVIVDENEDRRKEIRMLRDNLFSGTSVLESRKSVEQTEITVAQGHNIKLLTLVNMVSHSRNTNSFLREPGGPGAVSRARILCHCLRN